MLGSITDRFRLVGVLSLSAITAAGIFACASSTTGQAESAAGTNAIDDVVVESDSGMSTVRLLGLEGPVFTAFQQSDPDRVIVDIAGVEDAALRDPVAVYDGAIEEIAIAPFSTGGGELMTRVEISLAAPADYEVRTEMGALVIEIMPLSEMASLDEEPLDGDSAVAQDADPWEMVASDSSLDEMDVEVAAEPMPAAPAKTLEGVEVSEVGEGLLIHLIGDGTVESAVTFTLEDPARLVVDLPDMVSSVKTPRVAVNSPRASSIRVGAHPDKVRVVIDGGSLAEPFSERQVVPVRNGLIVALGGGDALAEAVADATGDAPAGAALASAPKSAGETAPADSEMVPVGIEPVARVLDASVVTIYGVEFDMQDDLDRVVVLSEHPVDYLIYEPDPETIVLSVENAVIDPEAAVRIAPDPGGPVSLVTAFDQPDVPRPEVRVVVKRAAHLKPVISRRGALLVLDFPRSGGVAATPPIVKDREQAVVQLDGGTRALGANSGSAELAEAEAAAGMTPQVFDTEQEPIMTAAPAAIAPPTASVPVPSLAMAQPTAAPAGMDAPASISILNEGGLMDGKEYSGRRISLDFKEVDIADVLRLIAEVSDLNVIAGDEVKGAVTIRLIDVPWDQALDVILLTKGLGFARIGNVLRIAAADVLAQEEELRLQERRAKEKLEDLAVKLQPVNYADVKDVSKMISQLLTERGSVNTDNRTNTLIIKDIPSVIDEATALVKAVDTMTPQVMIESKIVEAGLEFSREFGVVWDFGINTTSNTIGGRDHIFTDGYNDLPNQIAVGTPITSFANGLVNMAGTVLDENFDYRAQIQAAEVNGDGKVISSPRVVTLDNSEATIEQGVSIPFQTFENGDAQLEFVDAVLKLKVTPHITSDKSIIMKIQVSRNAPDDSVFTLTGSPAIAKNQVKTETLVKDGQTLVLGGIYVVDKSERASRVPYLHKIPVFGMMFRSSEISDSRKELLIFVTPRVVQTAETAS